ncbi:MAG: TetR family transcriptional regulator [Rubrivivax sp.]|nr:TetR family transcriptional regulator [Rubrivivax sp.]
MPSALAPSFAKRREPRPPRRDTAGLAPLSSLVAPATRQPHADSRAPLVLDAAARLFCRQGFEGTSVRDIASAAGMLPGSLYCHFATKDDLLVAVYLRGVEQICAAVEAAVLPLADPWQRLEAACVAHLEAILRNDDYARVVVRVRPADVPAAADRLVAQRDRYEALWSALVAALPLARRTDRKALRLMLLGALNWAQNWYRADGTSSPRTLARQFTALVHQSAAHGPRTPESPTT